ncbi:NACHT domain-containing protein [Anaerolineales bacterium HSG25]|nr:NACHT domain-containing protein [Anaerolineales bacterium HSG25]
MTLEVIAVGATAWLWEQYGKDMVGGMWSRLTGKFGQEWAEFKEADRWETAREAYRESLYRDHHKIRVLGHSEPVTLEDIYTDVYILDKVAARQRYDIQELLENPPERGRHYLHKPERFNGLDLVRQGKHPRLFILGKPGAGKTTFLRYLTLQAVRGKLNKVPLFINLKRWSTDDIPLMAYLEREFDICGFPQAEPFIQTLLETGRALVMFDGLDEVNKEGGLRQKINQKIDDFCRKHHKNQFLITCRIAATDHAFRHFQDVELADFTEAQIKRFVRKWFSKQPEKRQAFETQFFAEENKPVRELGNIPILLTLLCLAFDDSMSFPRRRVELYEDAIDALLRKWDSKRSIKRDEIYKGLSVRLKQRMFAHIANQTFEQGELFFEERKLVRLIEQSEITV